jgi:hypothetical protein
MIAMWDDVERQMEEAKKPLLSIILQVHYFSSGPVVRFVV